MRFFKLAIGYSALVLVNILLLMLAFSTTSSDFERVIFYAAFVPLGLSIAGLGIYVLYERFRAPDLVITVTAKPLPERFLLQEQRLVRHEQLKKQLYDLSCEIEAFNANLTPEERHAWMNRPGPYGK